MGYSTGATIFRASAGTCSNDGLIAGTGHWISPSRVILTSLYKYGAQRSNNIVSVHHLDLVSTRGGQFFCLYLLDGLTVGLGLVLGATTRAFFWSCQ